MTGRRATVVLALLCTLVVSAIAAPSAVALRGTTAYTCKPIKEPTDETFGFTDEHCDNAIFGKESKFVHEEITPGTTTQITATNNETGGKNSTPRLEFTAAGVTVEIRAGSFLTCKEKTTLKNGLLSKQMIASGEFCGEFSALEVAQPVGGKCKVKGGVIQLTAESFWTSLVAEVSKKEEMSVAFSPPTGKNFATFELEGCTAGALNKMYSVEGSAVQANVSTEVNSFIGATLSFQTGPTGEALKVNKAQAHFDGTFTPRMAAEPEKETNPIALETTKE
jgi:hypothetical protein